VTGVDDIQKKRPTAITVIAWIFIVGAILMIVSSSLGFLAFTVIKQKVDEMPPIAEVLPHQFLIMNIIYRSFGILVLLQVALTIFALIASIQFLRLRAWARSALEIISWLGLLYVVGFGIFWVVSWIGITSGLPSSTGSPATSPLFSIFGAIIGACVVAAWSALFVVIIMFLRDNKIKEAVS
jgi:hypothetical protein